VDDEPVIGKMITRFLGKHMPDYSVIYFTSGESALVYLKNNTTVGLLLTDIEMPGITGIEFARQVRTLYPALPIIVMSGTADGQHREEIFKLGADFISKPFNLADLLGKLMNLLGDKRSFCGGRDTENKV
jgi:DNA-binding response OmpR family regulator